MSRPRHPLRNRLEWLGAWAILGPLLLAPRSWSRRALLLCADLAGLVVVSRRRHAEQLVAERLGVDRREARRVVRGAFRTLAINVLEGWNTGRLIRSGRLDRVLTIEGGEHLDELLAHETGALIATAHFGSWEGIGAILAHRYQAIYAVGRPMDNPLLESLVQLTRGSQLAGQIDKEGAGMPMARLLRRGAWVGLLLDQNAGQASFVLDFLGAPTRQHKVAGVMAARFGAPVLPIYLLRESAGRLRMIIEAPIRADPELRGEPAERDVVARVSASLEARVRSHPEQWLWLHDRWKSARHNARLAEIAAARARGDDGPRPKRSTPAAEDGTTRARDSSSSP